MGNITTLIDGVCDLVAQKVTMGYGFSSPQAQLLQGKLYALESELAQTGLFPADWTHKSSIGKGNLASVMWIVFLPPGQTTQDGIYVSFCFGRSGNGLVAGCAISNTSQKKYSYIKTVVRENPSVDVDGTRPGTHYNNGYVNPLEIYKGKVDEAVVLEHIKQSIERCKECLQMNNNVTQTVSEQAKSRYGLWKDFLKKWPASHMPDLTLDEYSTFGGEYDSFCNWLEVHTERLGSVWGGSAYKFGVFRKDPNGKNVDDSAHGGDGKYKWYKCYGNSAEEVLGYVKEKFKIIADAIQAADLDVVDGVNFGHAIKWKIAFLYQPMEKPVVFPVYNKKMLSVLSGLPMSAKTSEMQRKLMGDKPPEEDVFDYYDRLMKNLPVDSEKMAAEEDAEDEEPLVKNVDAEILEEFLCWLHENKINFSRSDHAEDRNGYAFRDVEKKPKKDGAKKLSDMMQDELLMRLAAALRTKPFAILAGHSGTGKSRLVRKLAFMTCNEEGLMAEAKEKNAPGNYCMVQVKPNWHDSTDLIGYYSEMGGGKYRTTPFVEFVAKAYAYPETPFFVCLDEMNLAPVEQYFAEYLSAIESAAEKDGVFLTDPLIPNTRAVEEVIVDNRTSAAKQWFETHGLTIPKNLFVVGTVNMDETTCQFSRKVLDRAMTIEMTEVDFAQMHPEALDPELLLTPGDIAMILDRKLMPKEILPEELDWLKKVGDVLKSTSFAIAYRFANEYALYVESLKAVRGKADLTDDEKSAFAAEGMDHLVLMKVLPRIAGEREMVAKIFLGNENGKAADRALDGSLLAALNGETMLSHVKMRDVLKRTSPYLTFWP